MAPPLFANRRCTCFLPRQLTASPLDCAATRAMFSEAVLPETRRRAIHGVITAEVDGDVDIMRVAGKTLDVRHDNVNCFFIRSAVADIFDPLNVIFSLSFRRYALMGLTQNDKDAAGKWEEKKTRSKATTLQ